MAIGTKSRAIAADDVPRVFDAARIKRLADIGPLPENAKLQRFGNSIRKAACIYAKDARRLSESEVHDEIERLDRAAARQDFERVAELIAGLSLQVRRRFSVREATPGFEAAGNGPFSKPTEPPAPARRHQIRPVEEYPGEEECTPLTMPTPADLRDPAKREAACETVRRFCSSGGKYIEGRKRSHGKRSRSWEPRLYLPIDPNPPPLTVGIINADRTVTFLAAPRKRTRALRREAERQFVMHLQLAWLEAVGEPPARTARRFETAAGTQVPGPFARFVEECLALVGSPASAVKLINELNRRATLSRPKG